RSASCSIRSTTAASRLTTRATSTGAATVHDRPSLERHMVTRIPRVPGAPGSGTFSLRPHRKRSALLVCLCLLAAAATARAEAPAAHKARLSADLADHLAAGSQAIRVIVHGTRAEVDALAARYNVRVARYLTSGAVLSVNAGQLAALRDDELVDHLS